MKRLFLVIFAICLIVLSGCASKREPAPTAMATEPEPAAEYEYSYDSNAFVSDVTIPDNMVIDAGKKFIKTWRLKNDGTTTWKSGYTLEYSRGDKLGDAKSVPVPKTAPDQEANVTVPMRAPAEAGTYTSYWIMKNPQGEPFGVTVWAQIRVE